MRIGIPRALYYYNYSPFWIRFWETLGCEVVLSSESSKSIMDWGVAHAVDGTCLPVKVYYGHVYDLVTKNVDYIFVPQLISVWKKEYICPKFMGLPDMVRWNIPNAPPILAPVIDGRKSGYQIFCAYIDLGRKFAPLYKVLQAYRNGLQAQHQFEESLAQGVPLPTLLQGEKCQASNTPRLKLGLLGHEYLIYDKMISMGVFHYLQAHNCQVLTSEQIKTSIIFQHSSKLPKRMFWTSGRQILGAAGHLCNQVDGLISLVAFGCGTDSLTTDLVQRYSRRQDIPHLLLSLDEHTGEAGLITRLEAFIDMLERRILSEIDSSAHGE